MGPGLFLRYRKLCFHRVKYSVRSHCGGEESCRSCGPPKAEDPGGAGSFFTLWKTARKNGLPDQDSFVPQSSQNLAFSLFSAPQTGHKGFIPETSGTEEGAAGAGNTGFPQWGQKLTPAGSGLLQLWQTAVYMLIGYFFF